MQQGVDYDQSYSPVAKDDSICMCLCVGAYQGMNAFIIDTVNVFQSRVRGSGALPCKMSGYNIATVLPPVLSTHILEHQTPIRQPQAAMHEDICKDALMQVTSGIPCSSLSSNKLDLL